MVYSVSLYLSLSLSIYIYIYIRHRAVGTSGVSDPSRTSCLLALAFDSVLILPSLGTHTARPGLTSRVRFQRFFVNDFWAPHLTLKSGLWLAKVSKRDPKWHPKATPKPSEWTWSDLAKHMVFTVWAIQWPTWGGLGNRTFLCLLCWAVFFNSFAQPLPILVPKGTPKWTPLSWPNVP